MTARPGRLARPMSWQDDSQALSWRLALGRPFLSEPLVVTRNNGRALPSGEWEWPANPRARCGILGTVDADASADANADADIDDHARC